MKNQVLVSELGIGTLVSSLISQGVGITDFPTVKSVVDEQFPGNHFSRGCLSWYLSKAC